MRISPFIPIVCIALILTSHIVAIDRELVREIVREIERDITRTDQNNNSSREPNRNVPSNNNDRR